MFSYASGSVVHQDAIECLKVRRDATGHVVHGPYGHVRPGVFRVDFALALDSEESGDPNDQVAILDIAAYRGATILESRTLTRSDLSTDLKTFSLNLVNREFRSLEYRVESMGKAGLVVAQPQIHRCGDVKEPPQEADPTVSSDDPVEVQRQVRVVLRTLWPQRVVGFEKIRLGNTGDGGYVCVDDFQAGDSALSLGINDDISWDLDAAARGLTIYQFDHTVDDPAPDDARMVFNKKMIAAHSSDTTVSLSELVREHDNGASRPNLILKMDIEGAEWAAIEATSAEELSRFRQILCEFHAFDTLKDVDRRRLIYGCLLKLQQSFAVAHVHGNSCGGIANIANLIVPNCIEFAFVNRSVYDLEDTDELFPGPLDTSCDAYQPDIYLGSFRY